VLEYRQNLKDLNNSKQLILSHTFTSENIWGSYHKGTICGLTNEFDKQNEYYQKVLNNSETFEWLNELKKRVKILAEKAESQNIFTETIIEIVKKTRILKKLPETEIKLPE